MARSPRHFRLVNRDTGILTPVKIYSFDTKSLYNKALERCTILVTEMFSAIIRMFLVVQLLARSLGESYSLLVARQVVYQRERKQPLKNL